MDLFVELDAHMKSITDGLPANWKAQLVKFEAVNDSGDMEGATTWTFRYRNNSSPQVREFGYLLCYLNHFKCPTLQWFLNHVTHPEYDKDEAIRSGLISRLIYQLAIEAVPDGDYIPWICRFAQSRCFTLKNGEPRLDRAVYCSQRFATLLYILREACASMMLHGGNSQHVPGMIKCVQDGHVINTIAPWIAYCKAMTRRDAEKESCFLAVNGDIICNNTTFRKDVFVQLIPLVRNAIIRIYTTMFDGDAWRNFVSKDSLLCVRLILMHFFLQRDHHTYQTIF